MNKEQNQKGISLIEVILSVALFALLLVGLSGAHLYGQDATRTSGEERRALALAKEGLEATRNIRAGSFANLTDGNHGIALSGGRWAFSGISDIVDVFTRQVNIATVDSSRKTAICTVSWQKSPGRIGAAALATRFTDWRVTQAPVNSCAAVCLIEGYTTGTCRANANNCAQNGETNVPNGALLCQAQNPLTNVCCCKL